MLRERLACIGPPDSTPAEFMDTSEHPLYECVAIGARKNAVRINPRIVRRCIFDVLSQLTSISTTPPPKHTTRAVANAGCQTKQITVQMTPRNLGLAGSLPNLPAARSSWSSNDEPVVLGNTREPRYPRGPQINRDWRLQIIHESVGECGSKR